MAIRINNNATMSRARIDLNRVQRDAQVSRAHLNSGLRINSGSDDASLLAVSEGMRAELGGLTEGTRNTERALDMLRTAEGSMNEISSVLIRMRELSVQSSNGTLTDKNREALNAEFNQLKQHVDSVAHSTRYNDQSLLYGFGNTLDTANSTALQQQVDSGLFRVRVTGAQDGTYTFVDGGTDHTLTLGNGVVTQTLDLGVVLDGNRVAEGTVTMANFDRLGIQVELAGEQVVGAAGSYVDGDLDGQVITVAAGTGGDFQLGGQATQADRLEYDFKDMTIEGGILNLAQASVGTQAASQVAMHMIDAAIDRTASERGAVGAVMNRLDYTINFTANAMENVQSAESTVRDADVAQEVTRLSRSEILGQSAQSVMIQSRVSVQRVMNILLG
ncbi:MAG: flagellin [Candidatus Latescibacteria bacterium]|nr:flagellin [Candidatus Latescibacterota bacterium]